MINTPAISIKHLGYLILVFVSSSPLLSLAQSGDTSTFKGIVGVLIHSLLAGALIPLAIFILFMMFFYSIAVYLWEVVNGSTGLVGLAKKRLLYPTVLIFIVLSVWSVLALLRLLIAA